jgi:hypothetical protein
MIRTPIGDVARRRQVRRVDPQAGRRAALAKRKSCSLDGKPRSNMIVACSRSRRRSVTVSSQIVEGFACPLSQRGSHMFLSYDLNSIQEWRPSLRFVRPRRTSPTPIMPKDIKTNADGSGTISTVVETPAVLQNAYVLAAYGAPPGGCYQDSAAALVAGARRVTKSNPLGRKSIRY